MHRHPRHGAIDKRIILAAGGAQLRQHRRRQQIVGDVDNHDSGEFGSPTGHGGLRRRHCGTHLDQVRQVAVSSEMLFCYRIGLPPFLVGDQLQAAYRATRPPGRWMAAGSTSRRTW